MSNPIDKISTNENVVAKEGGEHLFNVKIKGSVELPENAILYPDPDNSGFYTKADSTAGDRFVIAQRSVLTTDGDYADDKDILVSSPGKNDLPFKLNVTGTFTATSVGQYFDLSDEVTVNADASLKKVVFCTKYISATEGEFIFAGNLGAGQAMPATS